MTVILDNGHGKETPGKRSPVWPDGTQLFEWEFNRDIVRRICGLLDAAGIRYERLVPEDVDISLKERCRRANVIYDRTDGDCFLISVHGNAGGGTGWECYTSPGKTAADDIATALYNSFIDEFGRQCSMRVDDSDGDPDKEADFYILRHTKCPAVLTENFFMDNFVDCWLMLSDEGRERIAEAHYYAIKKILYDKDKKSWKQKSTMR